MRRVLIIVALQCVTFGALRVKNKSVASRAPTFKAMDELVAKAFYLAGVSPACVISPAVLASGLNASAGFKRRTTTDLPRIL